MDVLTMAGDDDGDANVEDGVVVVAVFGWCRVRKRKLCRLQAHLFAQSVAHSPRA